jgi:hypothetical protein
MHDNVCNIKLCSDDMHIKICHKSTSQLTNAKKICLFDHGITSSTLVLKINNNNKFLGHEQWTWTLGPSVLHTRVYTYFE